MMMDQQNDVLKDEITLKELIIKIQKFSREIFRNWKTLILFILPFIMILFYSAYSKPKTFSAPLTFTVNEVESKNMGGVGSILNQFGFGGNVGEYNMDKIVELTLSLRIVGAALFEEATINGQTDYFANHMIRVEKLHEKWEKDTTGLKDFLFADSQISTFNRIENKTLKKLYEHVKGNSSEGKVGLTRVSYGEMSGIFSIVCESRSEELSIQFVEALYTQLSDYYINGTTEKPRQTYLNLSEKTDSLRKELEATEYALAKFIDANRELRSQTADLKRRQLDRKAKMLTLAYGKVIENLEMAEFSLKNATPFFR